MVRDNGVEMGTAEAEKEGERVEGEGGGRRRGRPGGRLHCGSPFGEGVDKYIAGETYISFHPVKLDGKRREVLLV